MGTNRFSRAQKTPKIEGTRGPTRRTTNGGNMRGKPFYGWQTYGRDKYRKKNKNKENTLPCVLRFSKLFSARDGENIVRVEVSVTANEGERRRN